MKFIPHVHHTIEIELPADTVIALLSEEIQQRMPFWPNPFADDRKKFIGSLSGGTFRIIRNIFFYLNSFLPSIKGNVSESNTGTVVSLTMNGNLAVVTAFASSLLY